MAPLAGGSRNYQGLQPFAGAQTTLAVHLSAAKRLGRENVDGGGCQRAFEKL